MRRGRLRSSRAPRCEVKPEGQSLSGRWSHPEFLLLCPLVEPGRQPQTRPNSVFGGADLILHLAYQPLSRVAPSGQGLFASGPAGLALQLQGRQAAELPAQGAGECDDLRRGLRGLHRPPPQARFPFESPTPVKPPPLITPPSAICKESSPIQARGEGLEERDWRRGTGRGTILHATPLSINPMFF